MTNDQLRDAVIAAAAERKMSPYEIARNCDGSPTKESIRRYFDGRSSLSSVLLSRVCDVLELRLSPRPS